MNITADNGFFFGLGVFETINVVDGKCLFLKKHIERLNTSLAYFKIDKSIFAEDISEYSVKNKLENGVLKIAVSAENTVFSTRRNPYVKNQYENGFNLIFSDVLRNETSPFTYHKTLNCGDNIIEKQKAKTQGYDEAIFLNTQGEICEGATTNIFFIKNSGIFTPAVNCGLLNGTIRQYLLEKYNLTEMIISPNIIEKFDECFVTNSLMGIMPVAELKNHKFTHRDKTKEIMAEYQKTAKTFA
ncbi:MAG: aminotransferase class IV [Clostridiales bacterium]